MEKTAEQVWAAIRNKLPRLRYKLIAALMIPNGCGAERCGREFGHDGECCYDRGD